MTLLAKSIRGDQEITLAEHTRDVIAAAEALFRRKGTNQPSQLGACWLRFFKLSQSTWPTFHCNLLAACALHDWGKANDGFQKAVRGQGEQAIRHEHFSTLLIGLPQVMTWLKTAGLDVPIVLSAVLTHHLKAAVDEFAKDPAGEEWVRCLSDIKELMEPLGIVANQLRQARALPTVPADWNFFGKAGAQDLGAAKKAIKRQLKDFEDELDEDEPRRRLLWAVRTALIAADAVGSAMERTREDMAIWVASVFDREPLTDASIWDQVIEPRKRQVGNKWKGWSGFQNAACELPERALLLAPCGSGKTLAAWRWIAARLSEKPMARVVFLYPTRATATEGFRDYVSWAPESGLMHGTSAFELAGLSFNPDDERAGRIYSTDPRLFALGHWPKRIISATADQFLAFLQYGYSAICMLPALVDSVVVIDEVHSFDPSMFSALCEFLRTFDLPVLCMTATLPANRINELSRSTVQGGCGLKVYNEKPDDLKHVADKDRYHVRVTDRAAAERRVRDVLSEGNKRILWVVNTVARAQAIAEVFADGPMPVYCYHSRFTLNDRKLRHAEAVAAVRPDQPASLTVTTQVCEMSLDLDADVLVTEFAPVTSLIQRMGRCNRHRDTRLGAGEVLVYSPGDKPGDQKPYDTASLRDVPGFLKSVTAKEWIGQTELESALGRLPLVTELPKACQFTASGPYADSREESFRDIEEFTVPAVLDRDVPEFLLLRQQKLPTDGLIVPVPKRFADDPPEGLPKWVRVAPSAYYNSTLGFREPPRQNGGAL